VLWRSYTSYSRLAWSVGGMGENQNAGRQTDRPLPVPLGPQIHRAVSSVVKSWRLWETFDLFELPGRVGGGGSR
jgi:hypothetical protein